MERKDIIVHKVNEATMFIKTDTDILQELSDYTSAYVPNYRFMPAVKMGKWNGKLYALDSRTNYMGIGLLDKVKQFANKGRYTLDVKFDVGVEVDYNEFLKFVEELNIPFEVRDYQLQAAYDCITKQHLNVSSSTGCHKKGDKILMSTGIWKNIEDVNIGEYVIGNDGKFKKVLKLVKGEDDLYEICPKNKRQKITVNSDHILPLKLSDYNNKTSGNKDYIENISVKEYICKKGHFKHISNIFYNNNEIEFSNSTNLGHVNLTPYFIGLYLGDGSSHSCQVTNKDEECITEIYKQADLLGCSVIKKNELHYNIIGQNETGNKVFSEFEKIGLVFSSNKNKHLKCADRFIPEQIFTSTVQYRYEVLAGLIDSDGHLSNGTVYELTFKSEQICEDIERLSISLGFVCSKSIKYNKKYDKNYYRILIMGDIKKIPVRVERKKCIKPYRKHDSYRSSFTVEYVGKNEYYGMNVEDNLYITNGGMVTHNSGKSLIVYIIARWFVKHDIKTLIVVPAIQLTEQIFDDFISYGWEETEKYCCMIYAGQKRLIERPVIISTWQSLVSKDKDITKDENKVIDFTQFNAIIIDEAHLAAAKSLQSITKLCINASYRIGVSGSFPEENTTDWFGIVGALGKIEVFSTYKKLQDNNQLSQMKIKAIKLNYSDGIKYNNEKLNAACYADEMNFVNSIPQRNKFIAKLAGSLKGNTLILFTTKDKHGKPLFETCKNVLTDNKLLYIDGSVPVKERELIRAYVEQNDNCVLCATYQTLSTGINIKRIHNIIFASGYKSRVKVIQSMGRGLRLSDDKDCLLLFDLVDDLHIRDVKRKIYYTNFSLKHFKERMKIYNKEEFDVELIEYNIKD